MIPAILSCIYVIYLYHTLNQTDAPDSVQNTGSDSQSASLDALTQRAAKLTEQVAKMNSQGRSQESAR